MRRFLRRYALGVLILACAACATGAQRASELELADDLSALAKQAGENSTPIMLVFTRPECPYCQRAKKDHLVPMRASASYGGKVIIREVIAADGRAVRDFDGKPTTYAELAKRYDVHSVPTVLVVNALGKPLADPIIGLSAADYYNLYLEQAVDAGRVQMRQN